MLSFEKLSSRPKSFRRITGVEVDIFLKMVEQIQPLWKQRRNNFEKGGRHHNLNGLENHLLAMLMYYRCYVTYEFLGYFFDSDETTIMRSIKRLEKIAVQVIHIEKNREISQKDVEYLILDATEQPVQRPVKGQKKFYSGKKKKHTLKTQYTIGSDRKIYCVSRTYPGRIHDFNIYKDQNDRERFLGIPKKIDSGYQGIRKFDSLAELPFKKPKNGNLTDKQKSYNHNLSKNRILVENVIRDTKIFKILSETYRNRKKGHHIKTNIIAGIVNMKTEKLKINKAA